MIRKSKKFSWPRKLYDSARIKEENKLVEKYGLKNKREIWKTEAKIKTYRNRAKKLINASSEEQSKFFDKLNKIGLKVQSIANVLALDKESLLKRRLSTVVFDKNIASTPRQARQMIVHKKILINERVVDVPSYLVRVDEEKSIALKVKKIIKIKEEKVENVEEVLVDAN